jgi:hypothetical protein
MHARHLTFGRDRSFAAKLELAYIERVRCEEASTSQEERDQPGNLRLTMRIAALYSAGCETSMATYYCYRSIPVAG